MAKALQTLGILLLNSGLLFRRHPVTSDVLRKLFREIDVIRGIILQIHFVVEWHLRSRGFNMHRLPFDSHAFIVRRWIRYRLFARSPMGSYATGHPARSVIKKLPLFIVIYNLFVKTGNCDLELFDVLMRFLPPI